VKDISLFKNAEGKLFCGLIEKGGRYREAVCLRNYQIKIERILQNVGYRESLTKEEFKELYKTSENHLFQEYTSKIDNHAFRGEYARELYQELLQQRDQGQDEHKEKLYRGYDSNILKEVSEALGHSRLSVVVEHYLR
jgi:AraC-like DNA-binding protein